MAKEVVIKEDEVNKNKQFKRTLRLTFLIMLLMLILTYLFSSADPEKNHFSISLDYSRTGNLVIFEEEESPTQRLEVEPVNFLDTISWRWIPEDINTRAIGPHNGDNFIAYTFYIQNRSNFAINYLYEINQDLVTRGVDDAVRIMIFINDEKTVYAKMNSQGFPEYDPPETTPFLTDKGDTIISEKREDLEPGDRDRITIVFWIEGDDPDSNNSIMDGVMNLHMKITQR